MLIIPFPSIRSASGLRYSGGFSEILVCSLFLKSQKVPLDGADAGCGDVAVLGLELLGIVPTNWAMARRSLRSRSNQPLSSAILKVMLSTPLWISLRLRIRSEAAAHFRDGGTDRMALFSKNIPEGYRIILKAEILQAELAHLSVTFGFSPPGKGKPERSPFTSP